MLDTRATFAYSMLVADILNDICPHCRVAVAAPVQFTEIRRGSPDGGSAGMWTVRHYDCPSCEQAVLQLGIAYWTIQDAGATRRRLDFVGTHYRTFEPRVSSRGPAPTEVPSEIAQDYVEACLVLDASPKAAAALSRRCLQNMLHDRGIRARDLNAEIDAAIQSLPSHLAESVDAIRVVGNFAAHPIKATAGGSIVDVEPHEASWSLDVLEGLFDFYYVGPARAAAKRASFNAKIAQAGKPPLK